MTKGAESLAEELKPDSTEGESKPRSPPSASPEKSAVAPAASPVKEPEASAAKDPEPAPDATPAPEKPASPAQEPEKPASPAQEPTLEAALAQEPASPAKEPTPEAAPPAKPASPAAEPTPEASPAEKPASPAKAPTPEASPVDEPTPEAASAEKPASPQAPSSPQASPVKEPPSEAEQPASPAKEPVPAASPAEAPMADSTPAEEPEASPPAKVAAAPIAESSEAEAVPTAAPDCMEVSPSEPPQASPGRAAEEAAAPAADSSEASPKKPVRTEPAAGDSNMEERTVASTSAEETDCLDVDVESKKLIGLGNKHLVLGNIPAAVNAFQEASSMLGKKYGETADECGEAFFLYGKSLLELARMENGVFGNALEGVPEEEDEEDTKEQDSQIEKPDDVDEDGEGSEKENETTEDKENEEDDVENLQLAWEMLELAKVIFARADTKESQLHAAQAHLKLGEVSIESENYSQAVGDFKTCLEIQKKHLEEHDRLLAETHYQLAMAYHYSDQHTDAISHFTESIGVIEKRLAVLSTSEPSAEDLKEMEEIKGLLPDIKLKIEDSKEAQRTGAAAEEALKATLVGQVTSAFTQDNGSVSSVSSIPVRKSAEGTVSNCVSDISHLVRKKRKPDEESPRKDNEAKKAKQEAVVNGGGDADHSTASGDAEETQKDTPMDTAAAVESLV